MSLSICSKQPCGECHLKTGEVCDICGALQLAAIQRAYALLWRCRSDDPLIHQARRELLAQLTRDEQREAIEWLRSSDAQMLTKGRAEEKEALSQKLARKIACQLDTAGYDDAAEYVLSDFMAVQISSILHEHNS